MNFEKLKIHINDYEEYLDGLVLIKKFLIEQLIEVDPQIEETFWNHMCSLLKRIRENNQVEMEMPVEHELSKDIIVLTELLSEKLQKIEANKEINEFEKFLISIYFQQMKERRM